MITSFKGNYAFLSNFYPIEMEYDGIVSPTLEHAYQASKSINDIERQCISRSNSPYKAKRMGQRVTLRCNWDEIKCNIMLGLLRIKFHNPKLKLLLLGTEDNKLIEGNHWNDTFWGCMYQNGTFIGENRLGKLLMKVREEIR